jgi:hypothetical protein
MQHMTLRPQSGEHPQGGGLLILEQQNFHTIVSVFAKENLQPACGLPASLQADVELVSGLPPAVQSVWRKIRVNRQAAGGHKETMLLSPQISPVEPAFHTPWCPAGDDLAPGELVARRQWARRQGAPDWLWPGVDRADWLRAQSWIEEKARAILSGKGPLVADAAALDPDALGLACYTSGMGPLLGWWRRQGLLVASPSVGALFELHFEHNRQRMVTMTAAAARLLGLLHERRIVAVLLKGMHTAHAIFPDPATRPLSDIDLLVSPQAREPVEALLRARGYGETGRTMRESSWRQHGVASEPRTLTFTHAMDPWTIDLHHELDIPVAGGGAAIPLDRLEPLRHAGRGGPWDWPGLEQPLLLLHLAAHAGAGLHNMTLIRLVELHLAIRRHRPDWVMFLEQGARAKVLGHAWPALQLCERLVPGTVPQAVLDGCAARAPARVRRLVADLSPGQAQRVGDSSLGEHFMWAGGALGLLRQGWHDLTQPGLSMRERLSIYERRAWQVMRGRLRR